MSGDLKTIVMQAVDLPTIPSVAKKVVRRRKQIKVSQGSYLLRLK